MKSKQPTIGWFIAAVSFCICIVSPLSLAEKAEDTKLWKKSANAVETAAKPEFASLAQDVVFQQKYTEAKQLLEEGLFPQAIKKYKALARKYKNNPTPLNDLGVIYRLQGNFKLAAKQFNKVITRFPEYAPAYENLADTLTHLASSAYLTAAQLAKDDAVLQKKAELTSRFHQVAVQSVEDAQQVEQNRRSAIPVSQQVVNTMHSWINAWNARDLPTYLSHYSTGFVPAKGKALKDWAKRHHDNFEKSEYIRVYLDNIKMTKIDSNTVSVSFRELYESNLYETSAAKEIIMEKYRNSWLIKSENHI